VHSQSCSEAQLLCSGNLCRTLLQLSLIVSRTAAVRLATFVSERKHCWKIYYRKKGRFWDKNCTEYGDSTGFKLLEHFIFICNDYHQ
jgi:hypothetical protein